VLLVVVIRIILSGMEILLVQWVMALENGDFLL